MIEVLRWHEMQRIEREWEDLARRSNASPFVQPGWIRAWWNAFGSGELDVVTLRRDGHLAALLPLVRNGASWTSPTNWHTPEFEIVAEDDVAAGELAAAVLDRGPARLALSFVNADGRDVASWTAAARASGARVLVSILERSPYVEINGSWEAFERGVDRHRRSELRRRRRRLDEEGALEFESVASGPRIAATLEEGLAIEGSGWKTARGTAILSQPDTAAFYRSVARWAAAHGWLRLCFLRLDGRPIAFQYVIEANGVAYFLKGGYEPEYARYAPGMMLAHHVLRRAFEHGLRRYEFLGTDEAFKLAWTQKTRARVRVHAFSRSVSGTATWAAWSYGRPVAKRLLALTGRR